MEVGTGQGCGKDEAHRQASLPLCSVCTLSHVPYLLTLFLKKANSVHENHQRPGASSQMLVCKNPLEVLDLKASSWGRRSGVEPRELSEDPLVEKPACCTLTPTYGSREGSCTQISEGMEMHPCRFLPWRICSKATTLGMSHV